MGWEQSYSQQGLRRALISRRDDSKLALERDRKWQLEMRSDRSIFDLGWANPQTTALITEGNYKPKVQRRPRTKTQVTSISHIVESTVRVHLAAAPGFWGTSVETPKATARSSRCSIPL